MDLCHKNHEEVCFQAATCPMCDLLALIKELEQDVRNYTEEMVRLEDELESTKATARSER